LYLYRGGYSNFRNSELATPPVDRRRNRLRVSRYSSPRRLAAVTSGADSTARSYSRSPSNTQIVVWYEERALGGASQFQPPSSSCSPTRRRARLCVGRPK